MGIAGGPFHSGDDVIFTVNTHSPTTGAATNADSDPTYRVYSGDDLSAAVVTGTMARLDSANTPAGTYFASFNAAFGGGFVYGETNIIVVSATVGGVTGSQSFEFVMTESLTDGTTDMWLHQLKVLNTSSDAVLFLSDDGAGMIVSSSNGTGMDVNSDAGVGLKVHSNQSDGMEVYTVFGPAGMYIFSDDTPGTALRITSSDADAVIIQASGGGGQAGINIDNVADGPSIKMVSTGGYPAVDINAEDKGVSIVGATGLYLRGAAIDLDFDVRGFANLMGYSGVGYGGFGTNFTLDDMIRLIGSTTIGPSSGLDTATASYGDTVKVRVTMTTDAFGNRSSPAYDPT